MTMKTDQRTSAFDQQVAIRDQETLLVNIRQQIATQNILI